MVCRRRDRSFLSVGWWSDEWWLRARRNTFCDLSRNVDQSAPLRDDQRGRMRFPHRLWTVLVLPRLCNLIRIQRKLPRSNTEVNVDCKRCSLLDVPISRDTWGRKLCHVVAMDAIAFYNRAAQFEMPAMKRELIKAYTCFRIPASIKDVKAGVVTGNWGCGAFNGNKQLKGKSLLLDQKRLDETLPFSHHTIDRCVSSWTSACLSNISRSTASHVVLWRLPISGRWKGNSERPLSLSAEIFHHAQTIRSVRLYSSNTCFFSLLNVSMDSFFASSSLRTVCDVRINDLSRCTWWNQPINRFISINVFTSFSLLELFSQRRQIEWWPLMWWDVYAVCLCWNFLALC